MKTQLEILDRHLQTQRPDFHAFLQPPLSAEAIAALEKRYGTRLPEDLKALYLWKNGQSDESFEALVNNCMFMPLEEALDTAADLTSMIGSDFEIAGWWNEKWIPFLHNGGGSYICYDAGGSFTGRKGQLVEYWNKDADRNVIAPSLDALIAAMNRYYETVTPGDFDEFFTVAGPEGFPEPFTVG